MRQQNNASELRNELGAAYEALVRHVKAFDFDQARANTLHLIVK